jgi:hypothetical protein
MTDLQTLDEDQPIRLQWRQLHLGNAAWSGSHSERAERERDRRTRTTFDMLPQVESAHFRVFRDSENYTREMIITGCSQRKDHAT